MKKIIVFGKGEMAEVVKTYLDRLDEVELSGFTLNREYVDTDTYLGLPLIAFEDINDIYPNNEYMLFTAIGYSEMNKLRERVFLEGKEKGYTFYSYISDKASIDPTSKIGENCFIFEDNTIQAHTEIKDNCILWSGNHIGHHTVIHENNFLTSHVVVSGGVDVGRNSFIGVNATLRDHIKIGEATLIGAAAIIMKSTDDFSVYVPERTKPIAKKSSELKI